MKTLVLLLISALLLMPAMGAVAQDDDRLNVVATSTYVADVTRIVGGDAVDVIGLMGSGVDPHLYQPTEADIRAMNEADAVFYNGLHLEGQFDEVFAALGESNIRTYAVAKPIVDNGFVLPAGDTDDPHIWNDPRNWQLVAQGVADVLSELDPANADTYQANAAAYQAQLDILFAWATEAMQQVPEGQRVLVTSHDAFAYFGDAFGWQVRGLQGISTEDEAGVGDIQDLVNFIVENAIPVIFVESSVPPDTIEAVQEGAAAQDWDVQVGIRELYSDAMGNQGDFDGTYTGMLTSNVITILQSFGVAVPDYPEELPTLPEDFFAIDLE